VDLKVLDFISGVSVSILDEEETLVFVAAVDFEDLSTLKFVTKCDMDERLSVLVLKYFHDAKILHFLTIFF